MCPPIRDKAQLDAPMVYLQPAAPRAENGTRAVEQVCERVFVCFGLLARASEPELSSRTKPRAPAPYMSVR
eukprot:630498-Pyramimonas_sp.AAC.1